MVFCLLLSYKMGLVAGYGEMFLVESGICDCREGVLCSEPQSVGVRDSG